MTAATIALAILWLAPSLPSHRAKTYGRIIQRESKRYGIDPFIVVAHIKVESHCGAWDQEAKSPTHDYGLMQVHVSATTYPEYLGREHELFDPALNIRLGVRLMHAWRAYHKRQCRGDDHHWWPSHMKWGRRVKCPRSGRKLRKVYQALTRRFGGAA